MACACVCVCVCAHAQCTNRIVAPQSVLFIAVDGVAPRAKMNQQRQRRLRSALEAQKSQSFVALSGGLLAMPKKE